ncbi:MAG: hypothetical protein GF383_01580 [Candidatus Lokiarchaeota archaeon]|nr:hypothetical protein [Candidatus Lokiarchaeota archaeon]MBD3337971.1 hypothetical protein [Candidatus Lokiarchaeota archaeon]
MENIPSNITPSKILEEYDRGTIDKLSALNLLITLINNSNDNNERCQCVKFLERLLHLGLPVFKFLENLMVSDSHSEIRILSSSLIAKYFQNKAQKLLKWVLDHEKEYNCLVSAIQNLQSIEHPYAKELLVEEIQKILNTNYLIQGKSFTTKCFKKDLKRLAQKKQLCDFSKQELGEIIINYYTIKNLKAKFINVYYELENALITVLDLSDIEYEVRGWKAEFNNNIRELSQITGLSNLRNIKKLYLAHNYISDIKDLIHLRKITHLYLAKNQLVAPENLEYLKMFPDLRILDISGNPIAEKINLSDFRGVQIKLREHFHYI